MSRMKLIARNILLAVTIGFATYASLQHASAQGGVSHDDRQRFAIAVPDFPDSSTSDGASWSTMAQAIASDLRASGRFELIESNLPVESNVRLPKAGWTPCRSSTDGARPMPNGF
jgi:hypothetical protein